MLKDSYDKNPYKAVYAENPTISVSLQKGTDAATSTSAKVNRRQDRMCYPKCTTYAWNIQEAAKRSRT